MSTLEIIGRVERVSFPTLSARKVPAKVDTGADISSIWCSRMELKDGILHCTFFDKDSQYYTGETVHFAKKEYSMTRIANSFGHKEMRYKVKIPMVIKSRTIKATFTLTNRSTKLYPVLIGRSMLRNKFIVDVSRGTPLHEEENARQKRLKNEMKRLKKELNV